VDACGYPDGVLPTDYIPVLALLPRRLSTEEVELVAHELLTRRGDFDDIDIGVAITQITEDLPTPEDIEQVRQRLAAQASPSHDSRDGKDTVLGLPPPLRAESEALMQVGDGGAHPTGPTAHADV
jgi:hypothetical protein